MPLLAGKRNVGPNIEELEGTGRPHNQAVAIALDVLRRKRAEGGRVHVGPIHSHVAGRTDHLPMSVPSGAYVIPADIVSGLGQGNTLAGFRVAKNIFGQPFYGSAKPGAGRPYGATGTPYGVPMPTKAAGGSAGEVPIVAAGGEYVVHPEAVTRLGKGSLDDGHKILDAFVKRYRARTIKTLRKLPGPKRD